MSRDECTNRMLQYPSAFYPLENGLSPEDQNRQLPIQIPGNLLQTKYVLLVIV